MPKKTNVEEIKLYGGDVTLLYYPDSHRYKLKGERKYLISATAATGVLFKDLVPWAVGLFATHIRQQAELKDTFSREELLLMADEGSQVYEIVKTQASSIGDQVHRWAEEFTLAEILGSMQPEISPDFDVEVVRGINAFLDWFTQNKVQFHEAERKVYSKEHGFCGITDCVATVNGERCIVDYKTSKSIYDNHRFQIASYFYAYNEEQIYVGKAKERAVKGLILHFDKETGKAKPFEILDDLQADYIAFLSCLNVKKRLKELKTQWYAKNK